MNLRQAVILFAVLALSAVFFIPGGLVAQKTGYVPDKELCAKMLAAGKEAYKRGRYLDAKEFFRKAVQADNRSQKAWRYYDQTVIFALAEKVEKNNDLIVPDVSIRSEGGGGAVTHGQTPVIQPIVSDQPTGKSGGDDDFEPIEEEGC